MYWQEAKETLLQEYLSGSRRGLVSDFDGTLSPIVKDRDQAQITPRSRDLLAALHPHLTLTAVLSGRGVDDLREHVGVPELTYAGNHGLERIVNGAVQPVPEAQAFRPRIESAIAALRLQPGMALEDKGFTISIHYRNTADPVAITATYTPILQALAAQHDLVFFQGRMIFELRPPINVNKGTVLSNLVTEYDLTAVIFLGDDVTDVDALKVAQSLRESGTCFALGIGVESPEMPVSVRDHADVLAFDPADVEAFLAWLLDALSRRGA